MRCAINWSIKSLGSLPPLLARWFASGTLLLSEHSPRITSPDFSLRVWKRGASQAAEKPFLDGPRQGPTVSSRR
jgi:hypothetical protein